MNLVSGYGSVQSSYHSVGSTPANAGCSSGRLMHHDYSGASSSYPSSGNCSSPSMTSSPSSPPTFKQFQLHQQHHYQQHQNQSNSRSPAAFSDPGASSVPPPLHLGGGAYLPSSTAAAAAVGGAWTPSPPAAGGSFKLQSPARPQSSTPSAGGSTPSSLSVADAADPFQTSTPYGNLYGHHHPLHHHPGAAGIDSYGALSAMLIHQSTANMDQHHHQSQHHHAMNSAGSTGMSSVNGSGAAASGPIVTGGSPSPMSQTAAETSPPSTGGPPVRVRVVKRRVSANRKERRRTHSINSAFTALRGCIPNVPSDTKLSKIKTLRLATSYIAYLMDILSKDDPAAQRQLQEAGFKADIGRRIESREERRRRETEEILKAAGAAGDKPSKGRTGWPQQVWASELK